MALSGSWSRAAASLVPLAVAVYYAVWGGEYSAFDLRRLAAMQQTEAEMLATTRAEVDSLRLRVARLENDPASIERVARERFGMIRDGEMLYRFVDVEPAADLPARVAGTP
ncbi:hypothetical protein BH23GEM3_BH23GEM3_01050 [soil metagenome]|nr:septum formation initiator family protein [Gemmatimonadota bacterium]